MHDSPLSGSIQSVKWEWQSNRNPWSTAEAQKWTPYSKEDTLLLEKGFEEKKMVIQIGNCDVRLDSWIQIHRQDVWKVSRIRRVEMTGRAPYFCFELSTPKTFNIINYTGNPPIIEKWKKDKKLSFQINEDGYNVTAGEDMSRLREIVELTCRGILAEGRKGNWEPFAESIAKRLRDSINKNPEGVFRECIYAYTEQNNNGPISLYSGINKALKEDNSDKIDTLGPFCYLLQFTLKNLSVPESEYFYTGQTYRGLVLDDNTLELYKKAWKKGSLISFQCFVSTSKDINIVKKFQSIRNTERKVLLNIKVLGGVYIESLTSQHGEEEVLLPASSAFKILDIKDGETTTIFLEMIDAELNSVELSNEKVILMSDSCLSQLRCSLSEWSRGKDIYFEINRHGENVTPLDKAESLETLVTQAAEGIRNCGSKLGKKSENEGIRIAQDLLNTVNRAPLEIFRVALNWYTHENFLSREIGKYLNYKDPKLLKDLGAYMHLVNIYFVGIEKIIKIYQKSNQADLDTVYYSIPMSVSQLAIFEELHLKKLQFAFPSFVWTSSNRELAECDIQSNQSQDKKVSVLYNIILPKEMISLFNMRKHSVFPDEDDVLLPPNFNFKVVEIQKDPRNNMIEISLKFVEYVL